MGWHIRDLMKAREEFLSDLRRGSLSHAEVCRRHGMRGMDLRCHPLASLARCTPTMNMVRGSPSPVRSGSPLHLWRGDRGEAGIGVRVIVRQDNASPAPGLRFPGFRPVKHLRLLPVKIEIRPRMDNLS